MKLKTMFTVAACAMIMTGVTAVYAEHSGAAGKSAKAEKKGDVAKQKAAILEKYDKDGDGKLNDAENLELCSPQRFSGSMNPHNSDDAKSRGLPNSVKSNFKPHSPTFVNHTNPSVL